MARKTVPWRSKPQAKDFAPAGAYIGLILPPRQAAALVAKFKPAETIRELPKDIERASGWAYSYARLRARLRAGGNIRLDAEGVVREVHGGRG
jgi:hypothetical protein